MRMTIIGANPQAVGSECVIFGHVDSQTHAFRPIASFTDADARGRREFSTNGAWTRRHMRPGADLALASALVSETSNGVDCRTTGRLLLVSHSWSGVLQINDIGRKYTVDLYSEETRLVLLDLVAGLIADVTGLASTHDGVLALPALTLDYVTRHVVETRAWFRFVDPDLPFDPGFLRRTIEAFRRRPDDRWRLRLLSRLLPAIAARPASAAPPRPQEDSSRLRDEMRLLTAAVDGLARRAVA